MSKPLQHELPKAEAVFNLAGQSAPDPWRIAREREEQARVAREAAAYQERMQRTLAECPGFIGADAPPCPEGRGKVIVEPAMAGDAAVWLKRRFHVSESLELDRHADGITFQIAPRTRRRSPGRPRRKVSFAPPEQFTLALD